MKLKRRTFIAGGAHSPYLGKGHPDFIDKRHRDFGVRQNPSLEDHIHGAVRGALDNARVPAKAIQKGFIGNFLGELFSKQGLLGAAVVTADGGLDGTPFIRTEAACASGGAAITGCVDAIQAGLDVTMAVGAEVECTVPGSEGAEFMARACHYETERSLDPFIFPYLFARRARHYKEDYEATDADLDAVVLKAYENANLNRNAHMRHVVISQEVLQSDRNRTFIEDPDIRPHMRLYDCTHFSDGASSIIIVSEDGLRELGLDRSQCTEIVSYGMATASLSAQTDPTRFTTLRMAARKAYTEAGLAPNDISVAEVHDCFSIAELLAYEALGFCDTGEAVELIRNGDTRRDGRLPVNTGGGLIGFGHPVGATGVKQVLEIFRQMKGVCGDYQLDKTPVHGISANMGGNDRTAVVTIQRNL